MVGQSLSPAAENSASGIERLSRNPPHGILAAYFEHVDDGIVLIDATGRIAVCTGKAARFLGLTSGSSVLGRLAGFALRRVWLGTSASRPATNERLRQALRDRRRIRENCLLDGTLLSIDIRHLADAGWAITVSDASRPAGDNLTSDGLLDTLTGLPNRALYAMRLKEAEARLQRAGEGFAVLAVDLDRFKQVNDTLGHPIGDALLCKAAERLQTTLKPGDTLARVGGDEFAVLQSGGPDEAGTTTLARRIVDLVGRAYVVEGHLINIGASVGAARAPADGAEPDLLLKQADLALYRAKLDGRETFRFFEPEMMARMEARRLLELDLRKALAMREFELVYQPQMNLGSDRLVGCEALIRWRHPTRGTVSPADFIPIAEEIGLIVTIGEWVVRTACQEAVRWPGDLSVAVNLSPAQFKSREPRRDRGIGARDIGPRAASARIGDHRRRSASGERRQSRDPARAAKPRAAHFHGRFRDRLLVAELPARLPVRQDQDRSLVRLGHSRRGRLDGHHPRHRQPRREFRHDHVAEGVETAEQMRRIREEGCTDVQGYFISRPISANDIGRLFRDQSRFSPVFQQP